MENTNILIVEDEFIVARDLQQSLDNLGYAVCGRVNSAEKALVQLQEHQVDLVLMDIVLKGEMTGIEGASIIRSAFRIPVVYVTANTDAHFVEQAKATEPFGFVIKPFTERELQINIEMALYKHRMEEQLRVSEEKYRRVVEHAHESIVVAQGGLLTFVNPTTVKLLGYSREKLLSQPFLEFIHPADRNMVHDRHVQRLQAHQHLPDLYCFRILHKEGHVRWIELHAIRIEWEGKPAALSFMHDITERKMAEEHMFQMNAELETRVKQRTQELEIRNRELKDFAYVVSHDLKAPLRNINQLTEWLLEDHADVLNEEGEEIAGLLKQRVRRMHQLIEGILQYSRIGRIFGEHQPIDLNVLVHEAIDILAPPDRIEVVLEDRLPVIVGDMVRMGQIFQNLLGNAIHFMDKPQGIIRIDAAEDDACWTFRIADNGPGIEPKYHERVFQIFQTLQPRDEHERTGIGLTLVKKIVELSGGKIWIESTPGKGSTFVFTLPKSGSRLECTCFKPGQY